MDDHPENNVNLVTALAAVGISVVTARSTSEALDLAQRQPYGLIITDLGRHENGSDESDAGMALIHHVRDQDVNTPIYVYSTRRAVARQDELKRAGADLVTNRPTEIFSSTVRLLTSPR
ncbi:MAG: response regulator [Desertimonas sp.]